MIANMPFSVKSLIFYNSLESLSSSNWASPVLLKELMLLLFVRERVCIRVCFERVVKPLAVDYIIKLLR
jgi:hypothetical protein